MRHWYVLFFILMTFSNMYGQMQDRRLITLKEAIETGLKNNPSIKSARENIKVSNGGYLQAISLPQPEIRLDNHWLPIGNQFTGENEAERSLSISQSFDFPTKYFLKGSKYGKQQEIAANALRKAEIMLVAQIKSNYYKVLAKQEQQKIAEQSLSIAEEFAKKAEIRYNVGEGTNLEQLTAKVQLTESSNNLEIARNEIKKAIAELNFNLGNGRTNDDTYLFADSLSFAEYQFAIDDLSELSYKTNPQLKIAELNDQAQSIEKEIAWYSLIPKFDIAYFNQRQKGNGFYGVSAGITVPLWFMFEQKGIIQEATAKAVIAESETQSVKNEIQLNLKSAYHDYNNSLKQVKFYLSDILPQAGEVYIIAEKSYDAGEISYLEFLQARQTLIIAKSNYINLLYNYFHSLFLLEEIVGQDLLK